MIRRPTTNHLPRRVIALLLGLSLAGGLLPARVHADCGERQEAGGHHAAMDHGDGHSAHALPLQPAATESLEPCDHCPPERCASTAPCGGPTITIAASPVAMTPEPSRGAAIAAPWHPAHSQSARPPTPPPTTLL